MAAAYAVYEEALLDRFWFDPSAHDQLGVGAYSRVWYTNILLAVHLTAFHISVSICSSILLVERLFPAYRARAWAGRRGLTLAGLALVLLIPLLYEDVWHGPIGPILAAGGLFVALVVASFLVPRRPVEPDQPVAQASRSRKRLLGVVAFACTATHFVAVYVLPTTQVPWPIGVGIAMVPLAGGVLLIRRWTTPGGARGSEGLAVVTGVLTFFGLLDVLVGLGGRYDLAVGGVLMLLALWWLTVRAAAPAERS